MDGGKYLKVELQHRVEQETPSGWMQAVNVGALGEVGPLRGSGAFASAFNVCSDREGVLELPPPSCQTGIHPHPCNCSVWLLGCLRFPHINLLQLLTSTLASSPHPTGKAGFSSQERRFSGTSGTCLWL